MTVSEKIKLHGLSLLPSNLRGRIIVNSYLNHIKKNGLPNGRPGSVPSEFAMAVMRKPGNISAAAKYLTGDGKNLIPEIVKHNLGDHWYTNIVKKLSGTSLGNQIFMDKFLDKALPKIKGSNYLAQQFMAAGGQV